VELDVSFMSGMGYSEMIRPKLDKLLQSAIKTHWVVVEMQL